jgi:hypothetical protein
MRTLLDNARDLADEGITAGSRTETNLQRLPVSTRGRIPGQGGRRSTRCA